jgi:hypothetical protein
MNLCLGKKNLRSITEAFVFDGRNILDRSQMESIGFVYQAIGS